MAQKESIVKPDLGKLVKLWQRRIRHLRGWDITAEYGLEDDPRLVSGGEMCYGQNFWDSDNMDSLIVIRAPEHFGSMEPFPVELTFLHEIAHLILELPVEPACNTIASALFKLYPQRKKKKA